MRKYWTSLFVATAIALPQAGALAHPAEGYTPNDLHPGYGTDQVGERAAWSFDDIVFTQPYPDRRTLSDIEKYMLEGTKDSWTPGVGLGAWWQNVMNVVVSYDKKHNAIPDALTEEVVRDVSWKPSDVDANAMAIYANPITDQVAKLKSADFSPGDMYIRRLSDGDLARLAEKDSLLEDALAGVVRHPVTKDVMQRITLTSPVYYFRLYGRSGVILSRIFYTYKPE